MSKTRVLTTMVSLFCATVALAGRWQECMVITTDHSTFGFVCSMQRHSPWTINIDLEEVHQDARARYHDGLYYVVNSCGASNLQVLDPDNGYQTIRQFSLGVDRCAYDIAFRSDGIAFVSCYEEAVLLKVDVDNEVILDTYSTAPFADADGNPETSWMLAIDDQLYINCQRLDRNNWWVPAGDSSLLVFDMWTEQWVDTDPGTPGIDSVDLTGEDPYPQLELSPDRTQLRVGCTGYWGLVDGGVEVVDLASKSSLGFEVTEAELGGDLIDFESVDDCLVYAIVMNQSGHTSVRTYNRCNYDVEVVAQAQGYFYSDLAYDGASYIYLCDRTTGHHGIRVYDALTGTELTGTPLYTGLPPEWVVLPVEESLSDVPLARDTAWHLASPWPNPSNPSTQLMVQGKAGEKVSLAIYDLRGRRVRSARVTVAADGTGRYLFDGTDAGGRPVASGIYRVVAEAGRWQAGRTFTLVR